ncbi:MAG: EAL domain-containing protein [Clostridia bacterium]|nr:EAL domain-containing protein [Clostridia bacterium]
MAETNVLDYQVDRDYPPFSYTTDGSLYGFDPYLTNILFNNDTYSLNYSTDSWDKVYPRLVSGEIDLAGIIAITEERKREVLFTDPLFDSHIAVYTRSDFREITLDDLANLRVGVGRGYYSESVLRDELGIGTYVAYDDLKQAIHDLQTNAIDVVFENQQLLDNLLIREGHKGPVVAQLTHLYPRVHAYAISKNHPELVTFMNKRIHELKRSGVFEEIYEKYFYEHSDDYVRTSNWRIAFSIILALILIGALFLLLQTVIRHLKKNLQDSLNHLESTRDELAAANVMLQSKLAEIEDLAYVNRVTGLPNKNRFKEKVDNLISDPTVEHFCFLFLDLDDFKEVNEAFGHAIGDQVLQKIAIRLSGVESKSHIQVFNLGSDEFACLFVSSVNSAVCPDSAHMLERIAKPLAIADHVFNLSASGGIVSYPEHGETFDELFKNADTALYHAKSIQRGIATVYDPAFGQAVVAKTLLQRDLRHALANQEFELHYQPQLTARTGMVCGFEALVRWSRPGHGMVSPLMFIRAAEESQLIIPLGEWVLRTACQFIRDLNERLKASYYVSVNISSIQIHQDHFVEQVLMILEQTGLNPAWLELEITESAFLKTTEQVIAKLEHLRSAGIRIALDDFGTGYSSLSYLKELPMSTLKIDRSFILNLLDDPKAKSLTHSIIAIGHLLDMNVVAEGIETEEQLRYLTSIECDCFQGYLIQKPLPEKQLCNWLEIFGKS